jgi:hypothetical protein
VPNTQENQLKFNPNIVAAIIATLKAAGITSPCTPAKPQAPRPKALEPVKFTGKCYNFLRHVTVGPVSDHVGWPAQLLELQLAYFVLGMTLTADSGPGFITCVLVIIVRCLWHHAILYNSLQISLGVLTHRLGHAH